MGPFVIKLQMFYNIIRGNLLLWGYWVTIKNIIKAKKNGAKDVIVIERENRTGGILKQCIHAGFGLQYFGEELQMDACLHLWFGKDKTTQSKPILFCL